MKKSLLMSVAAVGVLALGGFAAYAVNGNVLPEVAATGSSNSATITTQATKGSGSSTITTSTAYPVEVTYTTMLDLLDTGYDFTAGSGANINFHIGGTVSQFSYNGTAHGNNEVMDVWAKASSTDGETLCYRCNKGDATSWYGGQAGNAGLSGASDSCEHLASISIFHYFRINIWSAGGTSMSIKNLTFSWTC